MDDHQYAVPQIEPACTIFGGDADSAAVSKTLKRKCDSEGNSKDVKKNQVSPGLISTQGRTSINSTTCQGDNRNGSCSHDPSCVIEEDLFDIRGDFNKDIYQLLCNG